VAAQEQALWLHSMGQIQEDMRSMLNAILSPRARAATLQSSLATETVTSISSPSSTPAGMISISGDVMGAHPVPSATVALVMALIHALDAQLCW
jgi:hypothetical protein